MGYNHRMKPKLTFLLALTFLSSENDFNYEIDMEKKFLTQYGDEEFRDLFEFGFNKYFVSSN
jgi:hypothetical protein